MKTNTVTVKLKSLNLLTPEKTDFLQNCFESVLNHTISARESLHNKAGFLFALFGGLSAFLFGKWLDMKDHNNWMSVFLIIQTIWLSVLSAIIAWKCMLPSEYAVTGAEPKNMTSDAFLSQELQKMKCGYFILLQNRIDTNRKFNDKSAKVIVVSAIVAITVPIVFWLIRLLFLIGG